MTQEEGRSFKIVVDSQSFLLVYFAFLDTSPAREWLCFSAMLLLLPAHPQGRGQMTTWVESTGTMFESKQMFSL